MSTVDLLHLCDSLFPTGGFTHSDGLEAAVAGGRVSSGASLGAWMRAVLDDSLGRCDGPAVLLAWLAAAGERADALVSLDAEVFALRPSSAGRIGTRSMGARLLRTWIDVHPEHGLAAPPGVRLTFPVAFGVVAQAADIGARQAIEGFMYTRLAAAASAAMRLIAVGQSEAHALLAGMLARVPAAAGEVEARVARGERPGAFAPGLDLVAMAHPHVASRLFLS